MTKGIRYQIVGYSLIFVAVLGLILMAWFLFFRPLWLQSLAQANFVVTLPAPADTATKVILNTSTPTPTVLSTNLPILPTFTPTTSPTPSSTPTATLIPRADYLLEVSSIKLKWVVHHIATEEINDEPWGIPKALLDKYGVVDYPHLAFPGEEGIVSIAGHRDISGNPFWSLDKIKVNDTIKITLKDGQEIEYRVYNVVTVEPDNPIFWTNTRPQELRLVTCLLGSTKQRVIIFAYREDK